MNRRGFFKSAALATVAAPVAVTAAASQPLATANKPISLLTPKNTNDLYHAINQLFKSQGEYDRAFIVERLRRIQFKTYYPKEADAEDANSIRFKYEGRAPEIDSYYRTPEEAVAVLWKMALDFKKDIRNNWTMEEMQDWGSQGVTMGELVWWRKRPELIETKNGLYTVYMRAEFA